MPASLQAALIPLIVMALSALAGKIGVDAKGQQANIYFVAVSAAALIAAGYGSLLGWMQGKKVDRAENTVPGITKRTGPESPKTIIINDPTSSDPPTVIIDPNHPPK